MDEVTEPLAVTRRLRTTQRRARILLAEDDPDMRDLITCALLKDGYEVVVASDGAELLAKLAMSLASDGGGYDLVVSDIRMPGCSGLFVLEGLRQGRWSVPVILMTAFGDDATRARVEESGGVLFDKPFDVDDLRTAVLHLLHEHDDRGKPADGYAAMMALVASCENPFDAWSLKWMLQAEGIGTYLNDKDVFVLAGDAEHARAVVAAHDPDHRARRR